MTKKSNTGPSWVLATGLFILISTVTLLLVVRDIRSLIGMPGKADGDVHLPVPEQDQGSQVQISTPALVIEPPVSRVYSRPRWIATEQVQVLPDNEANEPVDLIERLWGWLADLDLKDQQVEVIGRFIDQVWPQLSQQAKAELIDRLAEVANRLPQMPQQDAEQWVEQLIEWMAQWLQGDGQPDGLLFFLDDQEPDL